MAGAVTLRCYRPDLATADGELAERLQAVAELELARIRARADEQRDPDGALLAVALADGLARVTAGSVDERDLARAAEALRRGDELTVLMSAPPPAREADEAVD
jgi:regulator of protease activity HflC (stomatin/prohibitin superfamily)